MKHRLRRGPTVSPKNSVDDVEPLGRCPCGKEIFVTRDIPSVIHEVPFCREFLELDPVAFLSYVRRSRGIPYQ